MTDTSRTPGRDAPDVEAGPLLERALHLFDGRLGPDRSRSAGAMLAIALIVVSTSLAIAAAIGFVFFVGSGTEWLRERVAYFDRRPRLAAVVSSLLAISVVAVAFVAGRASARRNRNDGPRDSPR